MGVALLSRATEAILLDHSPEPESDDFEEAGWSWCSRSRF
jgi:hypothetical protein